jgi:hypothetical protein
MSLRAALVALILALAAAVGCSSKKADQVCKAGCANGLTTLCGLEGKMMLFCPNGCDPDGSDPCDTSPVDGAPRSGCAASSATIQQGALARQGSTPVAVTSFLSPETRVVIATSATAACASAVDAGPPMGAGSGAVLTLGVPANRAGEAMVGSDVRGAGASAQLTAWDNGTIVIDNEAATSGTVMVNLSQPGGGTIGSYDLTFASGAETGTFVAPACDACAAGR